MLCYIFHLFTVHLVCEASPLICPSVVGSYKWKHFIPTDKIITQGEFTPVIVSTFKIIGPTSDVSECLSVKGQKLNSGGHYSGDWTLHLWLSGWAPPASSELSWQKYEVKHLYLFHMYYLLQFSEAKAKIVEWAALALADVVADANSGGQYCGWC